MKISQFDYTDNFNLKFSFVLSKDETYFNVILSNNGTIKEGKISSEILDKAIDDFNIYNFFQDALPYPVEIDHNRHYKYRIAVKNSSKDNKTFEAFSHYPYHWNEFIELIEKSMNLSDFKFFEVDDIMLSKEELFHDNFISEFYLKTKKGSFKLTKTPYEDNYHFESKIPLLNQFSNSYLNLFDIGLYRGIFTDIIINKSNFKKLENPANSKYFLRIKLNSTAEPIYFDIYDSNFLDNYKAFYEYISIYSSNVAFMGLFDNSLLDDFIAIHHSDKTIDSLTDEIFNKKLDIETTLCREVNKAIQENLNLPSYSISQIFDKLIEKNFVYTYQKDNQETLEYAFTKADPRLLLYYDEEKAPNSVESEFVYDYVKVSYYDDQKLIHLRISSTDEGVNYLKVDDNELKFILQTILK